MDARTVLSLLPLCAEKTGRPIHRTKEVLGHLTEVKVRREWVQRPIPLCAVERWRRTEYEISHEMGRHFTVIAADVQAANREVVHWTQPLLAPVEQGLAAFLLRTADGVPHVLAQARSEAGVLDVAELGPTVQCQPGRVLALPPERRPRYLDAVLGAPPERIIHDSVQSEEGGRFHHASNRYLIVDVSDDFPNDVPEDFVWVSVAQLGELLQHSNYLTIEARTLLTALRATWFVTGERTS
jgi:NDP-hexose 2,3-dehydratase